MSVPCDADRDDGDENDRDARASSISPGTPSRRRSPLKCETKNQRIESSRRSSRVPRPRAHPRDACRRVERRNAFACAPSGRRAPRRRACESRDELLRFPTVRLSDRPMRARVGGRIVSFPALRMRPRAVEIVWERVSILSKACFVLQYTFRVCRLFISFVALRQRCVSAASARRRRLSLPRKVGATPPVRGFLLFRATSSS